MCCVDRLNPRPNPAVCKAQCTARIALLASRGVDRPNYPATAYTDEQWRTRASGTQTAFWLALQGSEAIGMIGCAVSQAKRFNLIGMWVAPPVRGAPLVTGVEMHGVAFLEPMTDTATLSYTPRR